MAGDLLQCAVMLALQRPCKVCVVRINLYLPRMPYCVLIWQQMCTAALHKLIVVLLKAQASHLNGQKIWHGCLTVRLVTLTAGLQNQGQRGHQALLSHPERLMPVRLAPPANLSAEQIQRGTGHIDRHCAGGVQNNRRSDTRP